LAEYATTDRAGDESETSASSTRDLDAFLREVVKRFSRVDSAESVNRQRALEDLRFKAGDQWPENIRATRTIERRPCLTINKMKTFVHQITNDQRQNRPAINVSPVGDRADPETAKMLRGLIRQIERQSNADIAYDTAFDSSVSCGWGYWRILTEYESEDSFDQVLRIGRIRNTFRVYLDPDAQEPSGSDAEWGFITDMIPKAEFKETWPSANLEAWEQSAQGDEYKLWSTDTHIRIAEYFYFETEMRQLLALRNGHIGFKEDLAPDLLAQVQADPKFVVKEREVARQKVRWCKLTSKQILEESDWPGRCIPIIRVIGDEIDIEGKVNYAGLIRDAKDPQRMYNFWCTSETELIALAPKAPWLMEEGQIEGHEQRWKEANNKSLPYLLYKGVNLAGKPAPPPQRQQFAGPPAGVIQAKMGAAQDMQATTGIRFDATLQERMYDESGRALRELKRVSDIGSFHYVDNLARSLRYCGEQLIDLIPKVYDTKRILTILREDDSEERIAIDPTLETSHSQTQAPDGRVQRLFNPKLGKYDVAITIGPNFATKRAEAADSMLGFMKAVPQSAGLIGDLIAKNMDWPGAEEISTRLTSMLPPNLLDKSMDNLPPEARGIVNNLTQQLQQLKQERDQAVSLLGDQDKDRAIDREALANDRVKMQQDYEAKMAKVIADFEGKMATIEAKLGEPAATDKAEQDLRIALDKIDANFQATLAKIASDYDVKIAQLEAKSELDQQSIKTPREPADSLRIDRIDQRIAELAAEMKGMMEMEIHFDRDPETRRITKARRVRKEQRP